MITRVLVITALSILAGAFGWITLLQSENNALATDVAVLKGKIALCDARTDNIIEDKKSDATVTDPGNYIVPDRWLLPETDTTNN